MTHTNELARQEPARHGKSANHEKPAKVKTISRVFTFSLLKPETCAPLDFLKFSVNKHMIGNKYMMM